MNALSLFCWRNKRTHIISFHVSLNESWWPKSIKMIWNPDWISLWEFSLSRCRHPISDLSRKPHWLTFLLNKAHYANDASSWLTKWYVQGDILCLASTSVNFFLAVLFTQFQRNRRNLSQCLASSCYEVLWKVDASKKGMLRSFCALFPAIRNVISYAKKRLARQPLLIQLVLHANR